jgi:quinone-modifying oxidoreductase subunit QmoC
MTMRVDPTLQKELDDYGAGDMRACFNCGNCTAVCPLSEQDVSFPRRMIRYVQLGQRDHLTKHLEPWLCYYCGDCSDTCPREAEPGETMMSLRRWLTAKYDFTGISRLFYRSWKIEVVAVLLLALVTGIGFLAVGFSVGSISEYDGPNAFLPSSGVHIFDWAMAGVLLVLLLTNCSRMWYFTMVKGRSAPPGMGSYLRKGYVLPLHFLTQKRFAQCSRRRPWLIHLPLMLSYMIMLVLIMFFLTQMWSGPSIDWRVHVFGYVATIGLLGAVGFSIWARMKKAEPQSKFSHESDWMFLILLFVVAFTGILQHILHRGGLDTAANITYVVHLMGVVPMLVLEVPFSKWAHLAYRPLATYFAEVEADAVEVRQRAAAKPMGEPQAG